MALDGIGDPFHAGFKDTARHGKVETDKALGVADKEAVAAFEQYARLIGKEAGQIGHIGQAFRQVHPGEIGRLGDAEPGIRQAFGKEVRHIPEVSVKINLELVEPLFSLYYRVVVF